MRHVVTGLALAVTVAAALGAPAHAEDVSAKKMQVKDHADPAKQQVSFLSTDVGITADDGYTGATDTGVSLHVFSEATANDACLRAAPADCQVVGGDADILKCRSADRSANVLIKPGRARVKFKRGIGFELDALASQMPLVIVLRAGGAAYCAVCGDGGSDVVVRDGGDGKQVLAKTCEAVACPAEPSACGLVPRPEDPVVLTGSQIGSPILGSNPSALVAFRWSGGWQQIPVQVDERANVNFNAVYNNLGGTGFCGPQCGGGFTRLDYTDGGTFTGADSSPTLDADDEVVFMASDAGGVAATTTVPPDTLVGSGVEVVITDPTTAGAWRVYLFRQFGALDQGAGQQYVSYQFSLNSGAYLNTYNVLDGPNPENTSVSTVAYSRHFSDRWVQDQLKIFAGGATGVDILDRHKTQVFGCGRTEDTFSADEGAFVVNRGGAVRALRSYVGANSGPRTQRQHLFYRAREDSTTFVRVHDIPPVFDFIDHAPAAAQMTLYDNNNAGGVLIDGMPDAFAAGTLDWQLVTGSQGSVTMVPQFSTDVAGFTVTSTYEDDAGTPTPQCTGDTSAYGASGVKLEGTGGVLPNTDPAAMPFATLTATRVIYYDGPGLTVADAEQRRTWATNPLTAAGTAWP
jgi:hypothetical protein